ncbi:hypothetical protein GGD38_003207 [Chitinophagaceae bacterium OAS944]|nr:hypothetical protein [Chitinophagaceae bacterium OAS944]
MDLSVLHAVKSPDREYTMKDKLNGITRPARVPVSNGQGGITKTYPNVYLQVVPTGLLFYFKPAYYQLVTLSAICCSLGAPAKIGWWWEFLMGSKVEKRWEKN